MNTNKSNVSQMQNDKLEQDNKCSYTPRTCGAICEQFEFDFGPEFTKALSKTKAETNAHEIQLKGRINKAVSQKAEGNY
jgi:hypothetical protein